MIGRPRSLLVALMLSASCARTTHDASKADPATIATTASASTTAHASASAKSPDAVSHASTAWDGDAAVPIATAGSTVDAAPLRARITARIRADRSPVTLLSMRADESVAELGARLCEATVPRRPPATPVLIKPNLGGFAWFKDPATHGGDDGVRGRTTDPEFVRGIVRCLRARGHQTITIAEGWGATHADWQRLIKVSGYAKMAAEERVTLVAMDDDGVFDVEGDRPGLALPMKGMEATHVPTLRMPKVLAEHLDHGLYISAPKIKTHRFGVVTAAIKGMQGTVMLSDAAPTFRQKWRMHRELNAYLKGLEASKKAHAADDRAAYVAALEAFAERIADVLEVEAPDVVLAEGAPAMGGDGFDEQFPLRDRVAIGGTSPIAVDVVIARYLGLFDRKELAKELGGYATSPLIVIAAKRLGVAIDAVAVTGDGASLVDHARPARFVAMAPFRIDDGADATAPSAAIETTAPAADAHERPVAYAAALGGDALAIDGRGDDAAWKRARPTRFQTDFSGASRGTWTEARFLWSTDALYVLWSLEEAGLHVDTARSTTVERPKLYEEDCTELFLAPSAATPARYFELEVGPYGHFFDIAIDHTPGSAHREDTGWSANATIATTRDAAAHTATIELKITAPQITRALEPGASLPMGLFRMEGTSPDRQYLAWSPPRTKKPDFHRPDAFGRLVLSP